MSDAERADFECRDCGAVLWVELSQRTTTCAYCRSPSVIERPASIHRPQPAYVLPFVMPKEHAAALVRDWQRRLGFFRSSAWKKASVTDVFGIYMPALLYSAVAQSAWRADIGEDYVVGSGKNRRIETEWYALTGHHASYVRDVLVSASRVIGNSELHGVEPFDLRALHRYTGALLAGWAAEEIGSIGNDAWAEARAEAVNAVGAMLGRFMPGDKHHLTGQRTGLSWEMAELVLVPVWVLVVRYDPSKPVVRLLVNGQTGAFTAPAPLDRTRIILVVGAGLLVALLVVLGLSMLFALILVAQ